MSYKKFINRNGKAYGPYIYESKREGNKVVSEYQGKAKNHFLLPIAIIFIILAGFLFIRFFQPTGRVVLQVSPVYNANETIFGDLKIKLKPGELLPADSKVSFKLNNQQIELPISQILSINSSEGKYYAENVNLEGEGQGYGFIGEKVSYPKVSFKLLVYQAGIAEQPSTPVEGTPETQETPAQSNETTSQEKTETTPSETSSTTETATTTETESTTPTTEIPQAEPAASETATQAAETSAPTAESIPAPVEAGITGGIIAESKIINGVVSKNQDYVYDLSQGESGTIVQGSIKTVDKNLSLDSLNLVVENDKAIVTTSYYESELGFGKDFLGENAETIMLSLKEIGFKAEVGILEVSIVYNDVKIAEAASKIMISEISENKFQEKSSGLELNETINETKIITEETNNITLKTIQYRPILGKPVRWQKNVKLETAGKVALEIPAESENISASKIIGGEEIQIKKDDIGTVGITGQVSLELELVRENALVRFLKKVWGSITGKAIEEVIGEENASVIINENAAEYKIEYYTPAPEAYETETDNGKVVEVSGPELDYTDILTYSEIPEEWSITSSKQIRVIWVEDNNPDLRKDWQFEAFDLNENGVIDYIEWNTPHLSNQTFEIIKIAKAVRLNSNRTFVEDVYDKVKAKDNIWQNIPDGEYLRVTFEKNLTNINDITIYARGSGSLGVYGQDSDYLITQFDNINSENWYKVYLTNLQGSQDVFDLKVLGNVDFDYVIDPYTDTGQLIQDVDDCGILNTANAVYTLTGNVKGNSTCFNITASNITLNCQGYMINFSANITGGGVGVFVDSENYTTIENCRIEGIGFSVLPLYAQAVVVHSSSNTSINNNTIIVGGAYAGGILIGKNSENTTVNDNSIFIIDNSGYGVAFSGSSTDNNFLRTNVTGGYSGVTLKRPDMSAPVNPVSFSFVDSLFINPAYGDVYFPSLSELNNAGTFNFTNTSNLENANLTILWDSDVYSTLNVRWYLDLVVNSSSSRLENVNVSLRDRNQVLKFSSLTNSSGEIGRKILTEFVQTASSTKTYYSLYNLTAGKSGYTSYENHTINMTKNVNLNIVLSSVVDNSIVTDCKELNIENQIYNLQNDVSSSGVCFNITANNITMNCNNSQITYGTGGIESYAFYSVDASNITIKNCNIIEDVNSANYNYAIYFINTTSSSIYNNTITTMYDSSDAIHMTKTTIQANITGNNLEVDGNDVNAIYLAGNSGKKDSTNNTIYKNDIIATYYPGSGSAGIYFSEVSNTTVESNIINMSAPTYGAYIYNSVSNSFLYNVIYGMDYVQGFEIAGSNSRFNKFIGNNFSSFGISTNGIYISADLGSNLIENNTIVSSAEGIYLLNTKANSINRNNITTLGDTYASGIYIGSSGDSSFIGNIILTNGTDAPGILDRGDNKNITIQDCVITTLGNSSYAIRFNDFSSFATGIEVIDTILNASFEYMQELDINSIASGGIWNFTNVTLPDLTNFETNWEAGAIGNLNLKWWVEVNVSNSVTYTQIDGAGVNITNVFGSKQYSQATNATGRTPKSSLREYMRNETNTYYDSLYTLAAEKSGYSAYSNSSINTTTNMWINVLMTEGASDTTLPLVQLVYPTNVSYNINVSSLNYSASDTNLQACWYSVTSGSINTTVDCGSNLTGLTSTEGSNAWLIGANDTSGNRNSSAVTFWKDTVLPVIYITNPKNKSYTDANLFFNLTLSENTSACLYQYDTSANVSMQRVNDTSFGARKTLITAAPHTVIFTCNDSLNNYNLTSISFTRDTTPPIIIINSPLNTTYESGSNILINITFGDDAQAKLVDYNGTNYTYTNIFYANLTNGTTRVIAFVNDSAGNQNTTIRNFVVTTSGIQEGGGDIDGPSITLQAPADGASTTSAAIDFQFDVTDDSNVDNCSLLFSDVAVQTTSSISKTATNTISRSLSAGSYSWKINCTDAIGNINGSSSRSLTISSSTGCSNCGGGGGCSSECTVGNLRCSGSVLQSCAKDYDSDSCYEWGGTLQTCSQGCSNGACINQNCTESWKCSDYGKCEVGLIKRNCTDDNNCGTKLYKPEETQVCTIGQLVLEYSPEILDLILPQGKEQKFSAIAIEQSEAGEIPIIARWYADNIKIQEEAGINSSLISLFKVSGSSKVKLEVFDTYNNQQVVWNIQYVNASGCREDWACDWSACDENGYSYPRSCYDKNNCGTNADYPRMKTCGREGSDISCRPTWKCSDWGECQVSYKMSDVVKNKIETAGEQSRTCQDESKCYSSTTEKRSCSLTRAVTVKNVEWCNEKYVEICDAETKQIVSRIRETGFDQESLKSVGLITGKVIKGVDIGLIVANFTGYCDYCYDDVKNYDETSVDCGGPNCPVCQEINLARDFSNWYRCWLWILFIILLIAYLIYLYKTSKHAKEKYHKKARESLMKKIKGFEDREMREWGLK